MTITEQKPVEIKDNNSILAKARMLSLEARKQRQAKLNQLIDKEIVPTDPEERAVLILELAKIRKAFNKRNEKLFQKKVKLDRIWEVITGNQPIVFTSKRTVYLSVKNKIKEVMITSPEPMTGTEIAKRLGMHFYQVYHCLRNHNDFFEKTDKGYKLKNNE